VVFHHADQLRYARLTRTIESPAKLFGAWEIPRLPDLLFHLAGGSFVLCLALGTIGGISRIALALAIPLYFIYFSQFISISYVVRKSNLIPQILLVLVLAPSLSEPWNVDSPRWPLLFVQALLAQMYLSSAYCKLRNAGSRWMTGEQMQGVLLYHHLSYDLPLSCRIARMSWLWTMSISAFAFESTFWIVLLVPRLGIAYAIVGITFHLATRRLMKIDYLTYQGPVYLVFVIAPLGRFLSNTLNLGWT
jgi:hypothetical protein